MDSSLANGSASAALRDDARVEVEGDAETQVKGNGEEKEGKADELERNSRLVGDPDTESTIANQTSEPGSGMANGCTSAASPSEPEPEETAKSELERHEAEMAELERNLRKCVNFSNDSSFVEQPGSEAAKEADVDHSVIIRDEENQVVYKMYRSEVEMPDIMDLITKDLSEPYSIYTYRYFIHNWPYLCILAYSSDTGPAECVGAVVGKLEHHKYNLKRGYIAMLAVEKRFRRRHIGSLLVKMAIKAMQLSGCLEVFLETEVCNDAALNLYEKLGFVRDKRLFRYYLNGGDAFRLKLWL